MNGKIELISRTYKLHLNSLITSPSNKPRHLRKLKVFCSVSQGLRQYQSLYQTFAGRTSTQRTIETKGMHSRRFELHSIRFETFENTNFAQLRRFPTKRNILSKHTRSFVKAVSTESVRRLMPLEFCPPSGGQSSGYISGLFSINVVLNQILNFINLVI